MKFFKLILNIIISIVLFLSYFYLIYLIYNLGFMSNEFIIVALVAFELLVIMFGWIIYIPCILAIIITEIIFKKKL